MQEPGSLEANKYILFEDNAPYLLSRRLLSLGYGKVEVALVEASDYRSVGTGR